MAVTGEAAANSSAQQAEETFRVSHIRVICPSLRDILVPARIVELLRAARVAGIILGSSANGRAALPIVIAGGSTGRRRVTRAKKVTGTPTNLTLDYIIALSLATVEVGVLA